MNLSLHFLIAALWLSAQIFTNAKELATIEVDHSKLIWSVKVTYHGKEKFFYEMIGKAPRGLSLEVWGPWEEHEILRIHAEDLAEYLHVDGFPADIREIAPGKSVTFPLNPKSMSATSVEAFIKWKKAEERGIYSCRVVFDEFSSPRLEISPPDTDRTPSPKPKDPGINIDPESKELFGIQLRRNLEEKNQALVSYYRGSGINGDHFIRLKTCPKDKFKNLANWDGSAPLQKPFHELVSIGKKLARQEIENCELDELGFSQSEDSQSNYYFTFWFSNDEEDITIELLPDGTPVESTRIKLNDEQYEELSEYGIPLLKKKD